MQIYKILQQTALQQDRIEMLFLQDLLPNCAVLTDSVGYGAAQGFFR